MENPEEAKPEEAKPEEVKPEEAKPEEATPENAKPEEVDGEETSTPSAPSSNDEETSDGTTTNSKDETGEPNTSSAENKESEPAVKAEPSEEEKYARALDLATSALNELAGKTGDERMVDLFTMPVMKKLLELNSVLETMMRCQRLALIDDQLTEAGFLDVLADALLYLEEEKPISPRLNVRGITCLIYALLGVVTDCSQKACNAFMNKGMVAVLIKNIATEECRSHMNDEQANGFFASLNLCVIHNIAKLPESQTKFDEVDAVQAIEYYFASSSEKIQISALSAVSCILNESELSYRCLDEYKIITKLVKCLEKAVEAAPCHSYMGFSAEELTQSLTFLAVCDHNKHQIAADGAIPLLLKMLTSNHEEEQLQAFDCLWALSFDEEIRQQIVNTENSLELLENIYKSTTAPELRMKARRALDYMKLGASGLKQIGISDRPKKRRGADGSVKHIFISYSWKQQETVLRIYDVLVKQNFDVWLDVKRMHGSTLEAMAKAVEDACLVLMCYSENYKQSNNCRAEAEYVFNLNKPFIPLNMQCQYKPIGWLGIILGAKLYVDFSLEQQSFDDALSKLLVEIANISCPTEEVELKDVDVVDLVPRPSMRSRGGVNTNSPQTTVQPVANIPEQPSGTVFCQLTQTVSCSTTTPTGAKKPDLARAEEIKSWTVDDVLRWLATEKLEHLAKSALARFDGRALVGLAQMKSQAPKVYYRQVIKQFGTSSLVDSMQFTTAMESLFASDKKYLPIEPPPST